MTEIKTETKTKTETETKTKKRPQRGLKVSVDCNVTVLLHGWPAETRMFSVIEACWMVDLNFRVPGKNTVQSLTYYITDDYEKAYQKFQALKVIAT
jgi:hypothetical protein